LNDTRHDHIRTFHIKRDLSRILFSYNNSHSLCFRCEWKDIQYFIFLSKEEVLFWEWDWVWINSHNKRRIFCMICFCCGCCYWDTNFEFIFWIF
jgi:hypothetical protein